MSKKKCNVVELNVEITTFTFIYNIKCKILLLTYWDENDALFITFGMGEN